LGLEVKGESIGEEEGHTAQFLPKKASSKTLFLLALS
jgi:hypothetical protein